MLAPFVAPQACELHIGPVRAVMRPHGADAWLVALSGEDPVRAVVPGLLEPDAMVAVAVAMASGTARYQDVEAAAFEAIATAAGRPWWEALRLVLWAAQPGSDLYGHLLLAGIDPARVTLAGWCSALYALLTRNADEKARNQLDFDLKAPPAGVETDEVDGWDTGIPEGFSAALMPGTA